MTDLFELLFKYRPVVFQEGDFMFAASGGTRVGVAVMALLGLGVVATYALARGRSAPWERGVMAASRAVFGCPDLCIPMMPSRIAL